MIRLLAALALAFALVATPALAAKGGGGATGSSGGKTGDTLPGGEELFVLDRMKILLNGDPVRILLLDLALIVGPGHAQLLRSKRTPIMNAVTESITTLSGDTFLDGNEAARVKKLARDAIKKAGFTEVRDVLIKFIQLR